MTIKKLINVVNIFQNNFVKINMVKDISTELEGLK